MRRSIFLLSWDCSVVPFGELNMATYSGAGNLEVMEAAVNYNRFLLSEVQSLARPGERILEIGAGIGTFAKMLMRNGYSVHCVETDLEQAARIRDEGLFVVENVEEIPDRSIDYVYAVNVLEHIEGDLDALKQWWRKLVPGGRMMLYVPAFRLLFSSMDRKVGHVRRYRLSALRKMVREARFEVDRASYVDCAGFAITLVYKAVGDRSGGLNQKALTAYDRFIFPLSRLGDIFFGKLLGKNILLTAIKQNA